MKRPTPIPFSEYHEDIGPVLWWKFPIVEPPYAGTPTDDGFLWEDDPDSRCNEMRPYYTHFTEIQIPADPTNCNEAESHK